MRSLCFHCGKLRITPTARRRYIRVLSLLLKGDLLGASALQATAARGQKNKAGDKQQAGAAEAVEDEGDAEEQSDGEGDERSSQVFGGAAGSGAGLTSNVLAEMQVRAPSNNVLTASLARGACWQSTQ